MISYEDLVEIARICLEQARKSDRAAVKNELEHIARGYQMRAASMRQGQFPTSGSMGEEPSSSLARIIADPEDVVGAVARPLAARVISRAPAHRLPPRSRGRRNGETVGTDPWTPPDNHAPGIGRVNCEKSQVDFQATRSASFGSSAVWPPPCRPTRAR
jgi:hypothetical protein